MAERINSFASDNCSGVHPEIMKALEKANSGYELSYGDDKYTKEALDIFKKVFGASSCTYILYITAQERTHWRLGSATKAVSCQL